MRAMRRARATQKAHSASKKSQPARARLPLLSVISEQREIMAHKKNGLSPVPPLRLAKNLANLATHFHEYLQRARGHAQNLFVEAAHGTQELEHGFQALARVGIALAVSADLGNTFLKNAKRGINFAALALFGDGPENLPDVLEGFEVIAAVAQNVDDAHDPPSLEPPQPVPDLGAGNRLPFGDFLVLQC